VGFLQALLVMCLCTVLTNINDWYTLQ
jgi:hypothetical protein